MNTQLSIPFETDSYRLNIQQKKFDNSLYTKVHLIINLNDEDDIASYHSEFTDEDITMQEHLEIVKNKIIEDIKLEIDHRKILAEYYKDRLIEQNENSEDSIDETTLNIIDDKSKPSTKKKGRRKI